MLIRERKKYQFTGGKGTTGIVTFWTGRGKGKVEVEGEEAPWQDGMFLHEGGVLLMEVDQYDLKITFILQEPWRKF